MLAAAMRDPPGLWLTDRLPVSEQGRAGAARIMRRVLSPAAQIEGIDTQLADAALSLRARQAAFFVLLLPPMGNLSNSFYSVHPRRNDRFVAARPPLRALFPEVDFADMVFTGQLLAVLARTDPLRLKAMAQALRPVWLARVGALLTQLPPRGVLLHLDPPGPLPLPVADLAEICGAGRRVMAVDLREGDQVADALAALMAGAGEGPDAQRCHPA